MKDIRSLCTNSGRKYSESGSESNSNPMQAPRVIYYYPILQQNGKECSSALMNNDGRRRAEAAACCCCCQINDRSSPILASISPSPSSFPASIGSVVLQAAQVCTMYVCAISVRAYLMQIKLRELMPSRGAKEL